MPPLTPHPSAAIRAADPSEIHAALLALTGFRRARRRAGSLADGTPQYKDGYKVERDGSLTFYNERGQHCHVPYHRVEEQLKALAEQPPDDPEGLSVEDATGDLPEAGDVDVAGPADVSAEDGQGAPARPRRQPRR